MSDAPDRRPSSRRSCRAAVLVAALSIAGAHVVHVAHAAEPGSATTRADTPKSSRRSDAVKAARPGAGATSRRPADGAKSVKRTTANAVSTTAPSRAAVADYLRRPDVLGYIDGLVADQHLDRDALLRVFADARYNATAARLMAPSSTGGAGVRRDWNAYRARFVEPVRLAAGYRFWDDNAALLARAEREFGVPADIIVGILGVETVYGRNTGGFRVIDALATLAFDYPNKQRDRSAFFREQLTDALLMARDADIDVATLRGSYAGAIGMPQFMPGSIRSYAIDYDGDGRIDLVGSVADVIGSVANFLARHGWVRDQPTYLPLNGTAVVGGEQAVRIDAMVDAGSVPSFAYADLAAVGLVTPATVVEPLALIDLPSGSDTGGRPLVSYLAGTQNFHVITRYNRSYFYAFSVIELGSTIKALRDVRP